MVRKIMARNSTAAPHCEIHPHVKMICPACVGASAAGITSKAKARASARNGKLGGRPKLPEHSARCNFKVTGRYTPKCAHCLYDAYKKGMTIADLERLQLAGPVKKATI